MYAKIITAICNRFPEVIPHLQGKARWIACANNPTEYKTVEFFQRTVERLIASVYRADIQSEFIDIMANLISGQLRQAVEQAWKDEGGDGAIPAYLNELVMSATVRQFAFVDRLYADIVNARELELPLEPLTRRASLWAQRWTETYNEAITLIVGARGGNLVWRLGATKEHCSTCAALDGIVAAASEWEMLNVRPQAAPNPVLECGGWRCGCSLQPTTQRRSPNAVDTIMNIVSR